MDVMNWVAYTEHEILGVGKTRKLAQKVVRELEHARGGPIEDDVKIGKITFWAELEWENLRKQGISIHPIVRPGLEGDEDIPIVCTPNELFAWLKHIEREVPDEYNTWAIVDDEFGVLGFERSPRELYRTYRDKWFRFIHDEGARLAAMDAEHLKKNLL